MNVIMELQDIMSRHWREYHYYFKTCYLFRNMYMFITVNGVVLFFLSQFSAFHEQSSSVLVRDDGKKVQTEKYSCKTPNHCEDSIPIVKVYLERNITTCNRYY